MSGGRLSGGLKSGGRLSGGRLSGGLMSYDRNCPRNTHRVLIAVADTRLDT